MQFLLLTKITLQIVNQRMNNKAKVKVKFQVVKPNLEIVFFN